MDNGKYRLSLKMWKRELIMNNFMWYCKCDGFFALSERQCLGRV